LIGSSGHGKTDCSDTAALIVPKPLKRLFLSFEYKWFPDGPRGRAAFHHVHSRSLPVAGHDRVPAETKRDRTAELPKNIPAGHAPPPEGKQRKSVEPLSLAARGPRSTGSNRRNFVSTPAGPELFGTPEKSGTIRAFFQRGPCRPPGEA